MTLYLSNRDGNGKTSEEGHYKFQTGVWAGSTLGADALKVTQNSPTGMSVLVATGQIKIDTSLDYSYTGWNTTPVAISISTADPANPRISTIVAYVDKNASTSPSPPNNPGIIKIISVNGTAGAIPTAPNDTTIQSAVGAGNPYVALADVRTNTAATQILNTNITDRRVRVTLGADLIGTTSILDKAVSGSKIADGGVDTLQLANLGTTSAKLADGATITSKFQPSTIVSNFTPAGSRFSVSTVGSYAVPNCSMSYTAGPTNETLFLWVGVMAMKTTSGSANVWLNAGGARTGVEMYIDAGCPWYRGEILNTVNVSANATITLAVNVTNDTATAIAVTNETARWMPTIRGFSIYRP